MKNIYKLDRVRRNVDSGVFRRKHEQYLEIEYEAENELL